MKKYVFFCLPFYMTILECTNLGRLSPIFIKASKNLQNKPTKAHVKFENYRMAFERGSPSIKGFSLTREDYWDRYWNSNFSFSSSSSFRKSRSDWGASVAFVEHSQNFKSKKDKNVERTDNFI